MSEYVLLAVCGGLVGLGVAVGVRAFMVPVPALGDALDGLSGRSRPIVAAPETDDWLRLAGRPGRLLISRLARGPVALPAADLELTGQTPEAFLIRKGVLALVGALLLPLVAAILSFGDIRLPFVIPAAGGLALAVGGWFLPNLTLRGEAATARAGLRRALCSYLDLVSLRRDASEGPTQALELAAAVGQGVEFRRIRAALVQARISNLQPWDGLRSLGERTGVRELVDIADIASTAAVDGASIVPTLRARAGSLRIQLLTEDEAAANKQSEKMSAPVALLAMCYLLLFLYPSLVRLSG